MKKQETTIKWFWPPECKLVIFVGTSADAEEKCREISNCSENHRDLPDDVAGITRKMHNGKTLFVWLNEPEIQNSDGLRTLGQTLLHELVHVKQILENTFFRPGDKWPAEFEAYYLQSFSVLLSGIQDLLLGLRFGCLYYRENPAFHIDYPCVFYQLSDNQVKDWANGCGALQLYTFEGISLSNAYKITWYKRTTFLHV